MNLVAVLFLAVAIKGPSAPEPEPKPEPMPDEGIAQKGPKDEKGGARYDFLPYPPEVPKPSPAILEDDPEIADLNQDLDEYRLRFYRDELELRYGARMRDVRRAMGTADPKSYVDGMGHRVWWYGNSYVVFRDKRVIAWQENDVELPFGIEVAPRHYLPRAAYKDIPPDTAPGSVLNPQAGMGGQGASAGGPALNQIPGLSGTDRARITYLQALRQVEITGGSAQSIADAQRAGRTYYAALHPDGTLTDLDRQQISADVANAVIAGGSGGSEGRQGGPGLRTAP